MTQRISIIFKALDNFVRLKTQGFNGKVFEDANVEFFFAPDSDLPLSYFNLEMNAGGTALMGFHPDAKTTLMLEPEDFEPVVEAHSMPENLENEITEPVAWTVEYKLPISVLKNSLRLQIRRLEQFGKRTSSKPPAGVPILIM